jgi:hypothetical protein
MIELLKEIEQYQIIDLLNSSDWNSLDVDYHPPRVERVWTQLGENRLSLHVIHPCEEGESLLHPHAWPAAFHVLPIGGIYEQGIAQGILDPLLSDTHVYRNFMKMQTKGELYYEMIHPECCHYVRPIESVVFTVMLSGPAVWTENAIKADKDLKPLKEERVEEILQTFKQFYTK